MATLKRIAPGSAFKVGLIVYGFLGLIVGALFTLVALIGGGILGGNNAGAMGAVFGAFSIILFPLCYGLIGGVFAAIAALFYNLAASWVGGLQVELN